ncbi:lactonase family protein [Streptomyces sp. RS10V-4]|uniref:lactonase family protein n=1 Tax=Streptomyces rhizoryzae TaxID=2932493 RepID=UPI0020067C50|nr:lactonase family protein [Streptomyces rhizoryzae]MCK7621757.1 lactonase family protein [Streptomyces rhizoryzae]
MRAYIGSFTTAGGAGITTAAVDPVTGALTPLHTTDAVANPSYLAPDPGGRYLYAVSETPDGAAAAFSLTPDGPVPLGSAVPVDGAGPTHLTLAAGHLVTANYGSGDVSTLPLRADGTLGGPARVLAHEGSGPNADRQEGPHAHAVLPDPGGRRLLSVDLGTDSVRICDLDPASGALTVHGETRLRPGSGPRHLTFHPGGGLAWVVNELTPTVTLCRWDGDRGTLTPLGETSLLPEGTAPGGPAYPSAAVLSPDGRFAWVAIRGEDRIAVLSLGAGAGTAALVATVPCGGHWPRDLALHPGGRHLYAANERSGDVTWFTVDPESGVPVRGGSVAAPAASCVVFA